MWGAFDVRVMAEERDGKEREGDEGNGEGKEKAVRVQSWERRLGVRRLGRT